ncbi:MAG: apolipoprotein N-acyltransferase, partial [Leucobacter sp.]
DRLESDGETADLIVWPENSAEFDLPGNPLGEYRLARLAARAGAPIVVGSVLHGLDGGYTNSSLVWGAEGALPGRYDKRYPVPFAEYMPNRDFFHALAPDLVDLVQLEYTPGTGSPVLDLGTPAGPVRAGIAICFDIIFDAQAEAMVGDGAQLILAQTNNADFGRTDESAQQLAIARLRAVETGRALVNDSTVGISAIVSPDGADLDRLVPHTSGAMVAEVPLVSGETPALLAGGWIAAAWSALGAIGLAAGAFGLPGAGPRGTRRARRSR